MLRELFRIKDADKTEENLLHILSIMSENKKYILKRAIEILSYCKKRFEKHTPFIRAYFYGNINSKTWNDFDMILNYDKENKPIVNILRWRRDDHDSYFEYQLLGLIPSNVLISDDWKKLCKEEYLKKKNESEISKIEQEKLQKIQKEKEELERYIELKKKFGGDGAHSSQS